MAEQTITCPNCGKRIPISKALTTQIEADLCKTFKAKAEKREKETQAAFEKKLATETARLKRQIKKEAEQAASAELAEVQKELAKAQKREKAAQTNFERRLADEKSRLKKQVAAEFEEKLQSHELELEKKLSDAKRQVAELKRKLEQGSQQTQGEVIELELEKILKKAFPDDKIEPIAKGKAGADVLQKVRAPNGLYCGAIIWESKNTRNWSKAWLGKLRNDQRRAKAELAVLVSMALPKDVSHFAQVDGVWVTEFPLAIEVATALRINLMQVAILRQPSKGKHEKMELLYEYLSGTEFRHRVEAIVEAFRSMQDDLDKERQTMEKRWVKREKQIRLVIGNVSGMYGDMQAIVGQSLPKIRRLELPAPSED